VWATVSNRQNTQKNQGHHPVPIKFHHFLILIRVLQAFQDFHDSKREIRRIVLVLVERILEKPL
jgi:hypothetical protein